MATKQYIIYTYYTLNEDKTAGMINISMSKVTQKLVLCTCYVYVCAHKNIIKK